MVKLAVVLSLFAMTSMAQQSTEPAATGFVDKVVAIADEQYRYVVYVPSGYDPTRKWPLLVFLNGLGECGRDGRKQAAVGLGAAIRKQPERWPFVVAFPQKPEGRTQWGDHEDLLLAVLGATAADYAIDAERTFLTGLSQGGSGAWQFGAQLAARWAAVAPICGYRLGTWKVEGLRTTPVWAFHGTADPVVPMRASKMLVAELQRAGGDPVLTLFDGVKHNSWDRAYQESALAEWLRVVVDEPLAARYLAEHDAVDAVELRLELVPAPSAEQPWGAGTLKIAAGPDGFAWSATTEWRGEGEAVPAPGRNFEQTISPRSASGEARDWRADELAEALVWRTLEDLVRTGAYAHLTPEAPAAVAKPRVRLSLTVRGERGDWVRHAAFAGEDAATALVVAACERIWQRAHDASAPPK